jgi:hypothetical protein
MPLTPRWVTAMAQAGNEAPKDPYLERYLQHTKDLYAQGPETVQRRPHTAGPQPMRPQLWAPPWQSPPPNMCASFLTLEFLESPHVTRCSSLAAGVV